MQGRIEIIPLRGMAEIKAGDDIAELILHSLKSNRLNIRSGDILVITHKIVSKAEGRVLDLDSVTPSAFARKVGRHIGKDPKHVEVILSESRRLVRMVKGLIISESPQGFVCANAAVDQSNVDIGKVVLLPKRPDDSAQRIKDSIKKKVKADIGVIVSDTFGRPWREGQVNVAIGLAGLVPFLDYRGKTDQYGYNLKATVICIADELASAGELCMNKLDRVPVVLIRGYNFVPGAVSAKTLARKPSRDIFR